jgi:hypothetical protein
VKDVDRPSFVDAFERVRRLHGGRDWTREYIADLAGEYFDALADLPIDVVEGAAGRLVKLATRWPKPIDWRRASDEVRNEHRPTLRPAPVSDDGQVTYCCANCQDTGWRPACWCRLGELNAGWQCERHPRLVGDVEYRAAMVACACRDGNPAYQAGRNRPVASRDTRDAA